MVAFEAIHSMKRKSRGRYGDIAMKIDISKAYDRVDWSYLDVVLLRLRFFVISGAGGFVCVFEL